MPASLYLGNFVEIFANPAIYTYFANTLLVTAPATAASIALGVLAGYVFAKMPFRGSHALFMVVVAGMFFPPQIVLIPLFRLYNALGLLDTLWPMIITHTAMGLPICTLLMRNFFAAVKGGQQLRPDFCCIVFMMGHHLGGDAISLQQAAGDAGIFAGNQVHRRQHIQRPQGDIAHIANGCGDNMQPLGQIDLRIRNFHVLYDSD